MSREQRLSKLDDSKVTLFAVWNGADEPHANYLPAFFSSVVAQSDRVNLIWLSLYDEQLDVHECLDPFSKIHPANNIQYLCWSRATMRQKLADTFCNTWSCNQQQYTSVLAHITAIDRQDYQNVDFKVSSRISTVTLSSYVPLTMTVCLQSWP